MTEQKLTLADLATGLSRRASLPMRYSEDFVRSFFKVIADGLTRDNLVKVKGFGTFKLIGIEARESINVATGERFEIAGHTKVSFTPDPALRDAVNKPFVEFDTVILNEGTDTALMEATDDGALSESIAETQAATQAATETPTEKIAQFVEQPAQETAVEEPVQEEPVQEEPVIEEPVQEEPVVEEPVVEEPAQEEPVVEEPVQEDEPEDEPEVEDEEDEVLDEAEDAEEENIEESTSEETEMKDQFDTMPESNRGHSALWMILGALLFTAIGYCLGYYWHPIALPELCCEKTESVATQDADQPAQPATPAEPAAVPSSTDEVLPEDSTAAPAPAAPATPAATADYPQLEGGEYLIVGVLANDTMKVGKMLTKMAIQYYGDKDLYKYICTMNNIENPDVVPLNMPLLIPKLEKKPELNEQ